jgi:hypothetical protein
VAESGDLAELSAWPCVGQEPAFGDRGLPVLSRVQDEQGCLLADREDQRGDVVEPYVKPALGTAHRPGHHGR